MFTGENGLVSSFSPDVGIWESGTMVETAALAATAVGMGAAPSKMAAYGVNYF